MVYGFSESNVILTFVTRILRHWSCPLYLRDAAWRTPKRIESDAENKAEPGGMFALLVADCTMHRPVWQEASR